MIRGLDDAENNDDDANNTTTDDDDYDNKLASPLLFVCFALPWGLFERGNTRFL